MDIACIPGFPTEVSNKVEMPDIAELLSYPFFNICTPEVFYKHASEFQKKLFEMTPVKGNRKSVTIGYTCHIVFPKMRTMTGERLGSKGWHIDSLENSLYEHIAPKETVHLLLGHCKAVTEFNTKPLYVRNGGMNTSEFNHYINVNEEELGITGKKIELGRIYSFSNHIHRAVEPEIMEFRCTWRVRETDRIDIPSEELQVPNKNRYLDLETQKWTYNMYKDNDSIVIYFPSGGMKSVDKDSGS